MEKEDNKGISVKKAENFSDWYTEVIRKAELVDYAPVKGFMVIRPRGYAIWEEIQETFNKWLKENGVRNAYFPLLIPDSFFKREAEHAKGFAPELAYIKNTEEGELLAIRPTSETIMYDFYSKWIRSWKELPLKINQWCNVVRWEVKQTKPFIRTREFLWQEGHNVFASEKEAIEDMTKVVMEYKRLSEELLAIPVLVGRKSKKEKFPGAVTTMSAEALMSDGKTLQMGTSHNLGQGFAKVFNVKFKGKDEKEHLAWQTSWGFSTRLIGAVVMVHGDDKGLVIPPRVALEKVVIVPIIFEDNREKVLSSAQAIKKKLDGFGAFVDDREDYKPGWKFNEWELKGVPLRIEIGPKDLEKKQVVVVRRDNGKKENVKIDKLKKRAGELLDEIQAGLYLRAEKFLKSRIDKAGGMAELKKKIKEGKIVKAYFVDSPSVEDCIKDATGGAVSRIVDEVEEEGKCVWSGEKTKTVGWFGKGY